MLPTVKPAQCEDTAITDEQTIERGEEKKQKPPVSVCAASGKLMGGLKVGMNLLNPDNMNV